MSYADLDGVPSQTAGVSSLLASDWNTYVRDNFDSIKFGHVVVADNTAKSAISAVEGVMVYQSDVDTLFLYNGTAWVKAIDTVSLVDLAVTTAKINDLAVTEGKIAASAVTSAKIANDTIVDADINSAAAIVDTKLATIATSGKVSNSATTATTANTASTIVLRDAAGTVSNEALLAPFETFATRGTMTGTVNLDVLTQGVLYATANATGNWTLNVRGDASTTLNSLLAINQAISIVLINTNGTTAYYQTAMTIDGASVTPKWGNSTTPTSGNASSSDIYTFNILKTANTVFTVFASVGKWSA